MLVSNLGPNRTVYWTYGGSVVHLRPRCCKIEENERRRSAPACEAPDRPLCRLCTGEGRPDGSEGIPASSLPPDQTVLGKGSNPARVHTDPSCHMLADGDGRQIRAGDAPPRARVCKYCEGEAERPRVSVHEVAAMDPEDLGLAPTGER